MHLRGSDELRKVSPMFLPLRKEPSAPALREVPPIDLEVPSGLVTATFANG